MTTTNLTIANTILEQLGGRRFVALTGARNLLAITNGLVFKLPSYFAQKGINLIRIRLEVNDTYAVEFSKTRGMNVTPISKHEGIYWDCLPALFTAETGLFTTL